MALLHLVARLQRERQLPELATKIAHLAQESVLDRVACRADPMCLSEARGYIRAHARSLVAGEVRRTLAGERGVVEAERALLTRQAIDRVVRSVIRELINRRTAETRRRTAAA